MGDGGPLQIACFLVGADTSSGAIHATMVPDSEKMDMPHVVAATAKSVRNLRDVAKIMKPLWKVKGSSESSIVESV